MSPHSWVVRFGSTPYDVASSHKPVNHEPSLILSRITEWVPLSSTVTEAKWSTSVSSRTVPCQPTKRLD